MKDERGNTHKGIEVEQDIALPWSSCLALCAIFSVYGFAEEEEKLVVPALLVLGDGVDCYVGGRGGGETPAEGGRAIVDDDGSALGALDVIGEVWEGRGGGQGKGGEAKDRGRVHGIGRRVHVGSRVGGGPCGRHAALFFPPWHPVRTCRRCSPRRKT